jgi:hypothetical protein
MRLAALVMLALPTIAQAATLTGLYAVALAIDGNREAPLPVTVGGPTQGEVMLATTYQVTWTRQGDAYHVRFTRQDEATYWRLAVEARFAPEVSDLTLGYGNLPVPLPLAANRKSGQFYWFWENGRPNWLLAEGGGTSVAIVPQTNAQHGFFLLRNPDGSHAAQFALDAWKPGESVEWAFRMVRGAEATRFGRRGIPAPPARLEAGPNEEVAGSSPLAPGFVRVNSDGTGFLDPDGKPWAAMGRNQWVLPTLPPAEQERILRGMAAARMTVTRCGLMDCIYRPIPGVWNEAALRRLRDTLDRCVAHGIRVIICLEMSAAGYQYSNSAHLSPAWSDLYLLPEALDWYRDTIRRVVRPLRDHRAVLAWDVTNEPAMEPAPGSALQTTQFRAWLQQRYGTIEKLREAWRSPDLADFTAVAVPDATIHEKQDTPAARDFFTWSNGALADSLIRRAEIIHNADPNHLITISHWNPRLLRGHAGAEVFGFWAPHTYDLWANGPIISDHALLLRSSLEYALPDRRRPVVIEEFGISEDPQFAAAMRSQHIREFREAAGRWELAGLMHWWEMTPAMEAVYAEPATLAWQPPVDASRLAVYLPPSQEWQLMVYNVYMTRRLWGRALTWATRQGYVPRFVGERAEAAGCSRVLVLGDNLTVDEAAFVRSLGLPVWVLPGAAQLEALVPGAEQAPIEQ